MLQQTQVATVIPYYERWLKTFPSLSALARAPLSKALELWAGLGYYRRVRMFHQAANYIQRELQGKIPKTAEELRKLPGIGRYTAGAIASIAWGEKVPVLDGNVIRILTRIFAIGQSVDRPATLERLWLIAASLLSESNPGDLNQSLMELGATVCFPSNPECGRCPVRKNCAAHQKGKELFYPVRSQKDRYEKLRMAALVLRNRRNEVWLEKQPVKGRWGGLWMFPFWMDKKAMLSEILSSCSQPIHFLTVPHAFTKYRITLEVSESQRKKKTSLKRPRGRWFSIAELARIAFPSPHKKIAQTLLNNR
jgi:A/G-specific adenine glycosylase